MLIWISMILEGIILLYLFGYMLGSRPIMEGSLRLETVLMLIILFCLEKAVLMIYKSILGMVEIRFWVDL